MVFPIVIRLSYKALKIDVLFGVMIGNASTEYSNSVLFLHLGRWDL